MDLTLFILRIHIIQEWKGSNYCAASWNQHKKTEQVFQIIKQIYKQILSLKENVMWPHTVNSCGNVEIHFLSQTFFLSTHLYFVQHFAAYQDLCNPLCDLIFTTNSWDRWEVKWSTSWIKKQVYGEDVICPGSSRRHMEGLILKPVLCHSGHLSTWNSLDFIIYSQCVRF